MYCKINLIRCYKTTGSIHFFFCVYYDYIIYFNFPFFFYFSFLLLLWLALAAIVMVAAPLGCLADLLSPLARLDSGSEADEIADACAGGYSVKHWWMFGHPMEGITGKLVWCCHSLCNRMGFIEEWSTKTRQSFDLWISSVFLWGAEHYDLTD